MRIKCCVCKREMRKFHFDGVKVVFSTFTSDDLDMDYIKFPQPFCKKCHKEFRRWLEEQNIVIQKMKTRR